MNTITTSRITSTRSTTTTKINIIIVTRPNHRRSLRGRQNLRSRRRAGWASWEVLPHSKEMVSPHWDRRYPGRFQWELDAFADAGVTPQIDQKALEDGRLELSFDWPLDGKAIPLRAVYPDTYPSLRPLIYLTDASVSPKRHRSPLDGNLCLLGRDTRQWSSSWSVPELLRQQLRAVLENGPNEDPQGEPAEVWWNYCSLPDSYCLIDSDWSILKAKAPGTLKLAYVVDERTVDGGVTIPVFCGVVKSVLDADGNAAAAWRGPLPSALQGQDVQEIDVPWERQEEEMLPVLGTDGNVELVELLKGRINNARGFNFMSSTKRGQLLAFLYPTETQFRQNGESWVFVLAWGKRDAFYPGKRSAPSPVTAAVVKTLRAGKNDLTSRTPAISGLATQSVAVVGSGALGAPLAIELARNGIGELKLLDFDIVEPGNSVRWPLGSSAWGRLKTQALADFIAREYPATKVSLVTHNIGTVAPKTGVGDLSALEDALSGVNLVVDATASFGTTSVLSDQASSRSLPLVVLFASPNVAGGVVSLFMPNSGCPVCLEWAWQDDPASISAPQGMFDEASLIQPPGCAERTFTGTSFDLRELSLQAARLVTGFFARAAAQPSSVVYTLTCQDDDGIRVPSWRKDALLPHTQCSCRK